MQEGLFPFDHHVCGINTQCLHGLSAIPMPQFTPEHDLYILTKRVSRMILGYSGTQMSIEKLNEKLRPFLSAFQCWIKTTHSMSFRCFQYMGFITGNYSAPEHTICTSLKFYYYLSLNDKQIELNMKDHYNTDQFGLGYTIALHLLNTNINYDHYFN